jgi:hypothetical protein
MSVIYGGKPVGEAVSVSLAVAVMEGVFVMLGVHEGVSDGVREGVREEVKVTEGVNVAGMNGVKLIVLVAVVVGVGVKVGVSVTVLVTIDGVGLMVGERGVVVSVKEAVSDGVKSDGLGARAMAIQPRQ